MYIKVQVETKTKAKTKAETVRKYPEVNQYEPF